MKKQMKIYCKTPRNALFFLFLTATLVMIGMDQPEQPLSSLVAPTQLSHINFADERQVFECLTRDKAILLKNLIAQEQRGIYCPALYQTEELLHQQLLADYVGCHEKFGIETLTHLTLFCQKSKGYNQLISAFNNYNDHMIIETLTLKCRNILGENRYIINTYGSCEPYQDRAITPLHYLLAKMANYQNT